MNEQYIKMKHIEINIWKACNHKCIFCMSWLTRNDVLWFEDINHLKKEIIILYKKWYNSIWLLWWEPTIHPNFLELIQFLKLVWFKNIEVISNWSKFYDKSFLIKSIKNWLTRISISIHSSTEKDENILLWWVENALKQKIESIKNIIYLYNKWYLKRELSVNIVISKVNYKNIYNTILFLYNLWVKSFRINFIQLEWYSINNFDILALKYEDFKNYLIEIINLHNKYKNIRINFEAIPWCYTWLNYLDFIKYSEQQIDKEKDKISRDDIDLKSRDIINQLTRRKELKLYLKKCNNCFLKNNCEWLWKRYIEYFKLK
jgi:MoaA/NifB/PqqE/SkfB family radical SAM enzyme